MRTPDLRTQYRLVYRPGPERMPRWMRQIWAWL
jgi:hypothetical protein